VGVVGALLPWVVLGAMALLLPLAEWAAAKTGCLPPGNDSGQLIFPADEMPQEKAPK
jgi:hypothetical protein